MFIRTNSARADGNTAYARQWMRAQARAKVEWLIRDLSRDAPLSDGTGRCTARTDIRAG